MTFCSTSLKDAFRHASEMVYGGRVFNWKGDLLEVEYYFELVGVAHFKHSVSFDFGAVSPLLGSGEINKIANESLILFERAMDALGLVELISYWKCACPEKVRLNGLSLSKEEEAWWRKLWYLGLGEFRYLNKIETSEKEFVAFESASPSISDENKKKNVNVGSEERFIVPIGGGKDSVVTLDLLKKESSQSRFGLLVQTNQHANPSAEASARIAGVPLIFVRRVFDPKLAELNRLGYLNGHVPFSATLAFINFIAALLTRSRWIALSNESSANEPTVPGSEINHQYSKSFEFERDFQHYLKNWMTQDIEYFSILRPLSEVQIAAQFAKLEAYHPYAVSCNVASRHGKWCGKCSKCLFTYILLAPFLENAKLKKIFERNLLEDSDLWPILQSLVGDTPHKPFECVGTSEEVRACMYELCKQQPEAALCRFFANTHSLEKEPRLQDFIQAKGALHAIPGKVYRKISVIHPELFPESKN